MTTYDPAICDRLVADARSGLEDYSHDDGLEAAVWLEEWLNSGSVPDRNHRILLQRISGKLVNLSAMADQLEAAKREVARLTCRLDREARDRVADCRDLEERTAERDALRAELEVARVTIQMADTLADQQLEVIAKLRAEVEKMRPAGGRCG